MNDMQIAIELESLRQQEYPLSVTEAAAEALVECVRRIMKAVPEDDHPFVRADYADATSALFHPCTSECGMPSD